MGEENCPWKFIWNTVVPLLSYSCMFQVKICSQQSEICKSVCMLSSSPLSWRLINFRLFCSDDCRSLYLVKKNFGPMIADQEKINGVFDLRFNYLPFWNLAVKSRRLFLCWYILLIYFVMIMLFVIYLSYLSIDNLL